MSEQIDWSKAPEWATKHGLIGMGRQPIWFNKSEYTYVNGQQGGRVFLFDGPGYPIAGVIDATERPTTPSWSGEGLPPVGVVCEVYHDGDWYETKIIGIDTDDGSCVFKTHGDYDTPYDGFVSASSFRPIRTPEQIAADEREAAIKEMIEIGRSGDGGYVAFCIALYDAGLRFTKP